MLRFALRERRGVVILPPEYLKTTLLSPGPPAVADRQRDRQGHAAARDAALRGGGHGDQQPLGRSRGTSSTTTSCRPTSPTSKGDPLLVPDPEEKTWKDDAIIVCRRGTYKDPTWQAKGIDSKGIQGRRLDWLIGDDLITPANAFCPGQARDAPCASGTCRSPRVSSREGQRDRGGQLQRPARPRVDAVRARRRYAPFKRPACFISGLARGRPWIPADPRAEPLWPTNWPLERLHREKLEKPNRFQRIFLLSATTEQGEKLLVHWVRLIKPERHARRREPSSSSPSTPPPAARPTTWTTSTSRSARCTARTST